jgi:alkylhydroperoxidase/carboxymuconolactone decarboxylase family protein YurZ
MAGPTFAPAADALPDAEEQEDRCHEDLPSLYDPHGTSSRCRVSAYLGMLRSASWVAIAAVATTGCDPCLSWRARFAAQVVESGITDAESLLCDWRVKEMDYGQLYLEHQPSTSPNRVLVEDLAVTMLVNSRVDARQAMGVSRNAATLDLSGLSDKPLGETTDGERQMVASTTTAIVLFSQPWSGP